jgi:hypothetical protein
VSGLPPDRCLRLCATALALIVAFVVFPPIIRARQVFDPSSRPAPRSGLPRSGEVPPLSLVVIVADDVTVRANDGKPTTSAVVFWVYTEDEVTQTAPVIADGLGLRAPPASTA